MTLLWIQGLGVLNAIHPASSATRPKRPRLSHAKYSLGPPFETPPPYETVPIPRSTAHFILFFLFYADSNKSIMMSCKFEINPCSSSSVIGQLHVFEISQAHFIQNKCFLYCPHHFCAVLTTLILSYDQLKIQTAKRMRKLCGVLVERLHPAILNVVRQCATVLCYAMNSLYLAQILIFSLRFFSG